MVPEKILVVDDERLIRWTLTEKLSGWGYAPVEAETVAAALAKFEAEHPVAVLLDITLPDGTGLEVLREIKARQPDTIVIMITANVLVDDTIAALRAGAYDFISKPINLEELRITIHNGIETRSLRKEVNSIRKERVQAFSFDAIIGESDAIRDTIALARRVAASEVFAVLLQGESGTGKDLVAKAIHYTSDRADKPFVAINCAAIPANLLESELFGYEKGAFTDAKARKEGLFEQAEGGTLLLDEIGELELGLQAKLLRVLEEGTFRRVGGLKDISLDARVIAASNRDLETESAAGRFRLDLYYRLSVLLINHPPLRERGDDVLLLAEHFIGTQNRSMRKTPVRGLSPEAKHAFRRYRWTGNVRELRNVIERALILEDGDFITLKYLPRGLAGESELVMGGEDGDDGEVSRYIHLPPDGISLDAAELSLVRQAIRRCGGNRTRAAALLGITRDQVRYCLKKHEAANLQAKTPEGTQQ